MSDGPLGMPEEIYIDKKVIIFTRRGECDDGEFVWSMI